MFTRFLNGLENKFGRFGIPGLLRGVAILTGLTFILIVIRNDLAERFMLDMNAVFRGEVWRLFTFLFIPRTMNPIFLLFQLWILVMCGDSLEHAWGTFKLTVYYLMGVVCTIIVSCFVGFGTADFLNAGIFFAFATLFPYVEFRIYFVLPVQVRWLALIQGLIYIGFLVIGDWGIKACILVVFANYLLFFGPALLGYLKTKQEISSRQTKFKRESLPEHEPLHRCKVCRRTENDDQYLDFRVAADGEEYCSEHLPAKV